MIFKNSIRNLVRDKKNIISIVFISIIFALIILCFSFKESLNDYWNSSVEKLVDYRTYVVNFDKKKYNVKTAIEKVKSHSHVIEAFDESSYLISMRVNDKNIVSTNDNGIFLVGTIANPIKLVAGKNLDSVSEKENPIVCAKQFYPFVEFEQSDYVTSKSVDISNLLNKNISLSFVSSKDKNNFKIVGLYDAKTNHTEGNICYANLNTIKKLNEKYQHDIYFGENSDRNYIFIVIDDIKNENVVLNELQKDGFTYATPILNINKDMGNNVINLMFLISGIIVILSVGIILFLSVKKIINRKKDYLIMKTTGYSNKQILSIYILELLFEFLIAFIISIGLYYLILFGFYNLYLSEKIAFYDLKINISIIGLLLNIIISIIMCSIIAVYFNYKLKKNQIKTLAR